MHRGLRPLLAAPLLPMDLIPLSGLEVGDADADFDSPSVRPIEPEERLGSRIYMARYHSLSTRRAKMLKKHSTWLTQDAWMG